MWKLTAIAALLVASLLTWMLAHRDKRFDIVCLALGAAMLLIIPSLMPWLLKLLPWQWRPIYWCLTFFVFFLALKRSASGILQGLRHKEQLG